MRIIKFLITSAALVLSLNAMAGSHFTEKGTISAVDFNANTFSFVSNSTGHTKVYTFTDGLKINIDGNSYSDLSLLKPGQNVILKFRHSSPETANRPDRASEQFTMVGTIVEMDRSSGRGILRKSRSNEMIPFRFAENFKTSDMPVRGDRVVFTYRLDGLKVGMK